MEGLGDVGRITVSLRTAVAYLASWGTSEYMAAQQDWALRVGRRYLLIAKRCPGVEQFSV
jgi:hypothetical protein